jgi:hypothetical protein
VKKRRFVVLFRCRPGRAADVLAKLRISVGKAAQLDLYGSEGFAFQVVVNKTKCEARSLRRKLKRAGAKAVAVWKSL